jgi:HD-GYP domain-containing protein (c-di-GMP phosphodiesterase class II)
MGNTFPVNAENFQYRSTPSGNTPGLENALPLSTEVPASALQIRLSEIVSALSYALDLTEGQPVGHAVKTCVLGMRLADELQLSSTEKADLYYALLLKDMGCSSNAARVHQIFGGNERNLKRDLKTTDWTRQLEGFAFVRKHAAIGQSLFDRFLRIVKIAAAGPGQARKMVEIRCERGASIARDLGFSQNCADAIYNLDEQWSGQGHPHGKKGEDIPLGARILNLCQTLEVFQTHEGMEMAFAVIEERKGRWFDPQLVRAARNLKHDKTLWQILEDKNAAAARALAMNLEPQEEVLFADEQKVTRVCEGFAGIIDAKSPWTFRHSQGVCEAAVGMAGVLDLPENQITSIRHAALLHDIGKLSVPNAILDKPGKLDDEEFAAIKTHPFYTQRILEKISSFRRLSFIAGAHHERLDGSGYHSGFEGDKLPIEARIIAVADVFDALSAKRPYRDAMPLERALSLIAEDVPHALCPKSFEALKLWSATRAENESQTPNA